MFAASASLFSGPGLGAFTAFQSGRVREVAVVAFSRAPFVPSASISAEPSALERLGDPSLGDLRGPMSGSELRLALLDRAEKALTKADAATEEMLRGALRSLGGPAAEAAEEGDLSALMGSEAFETLPQSLQDALEARAEAAASARALLSEERREATAANAEGIAEENAALIDRAVADHVDALLAAEAAADDAETARRVSALSLFGLSAEAEIRAEAMMRLGRETERLSRRDGMIRDMTRGIARGEINVSVSRRTEWADAPMRATVDLGGAPHAGIGFSVYVAEGWRVATASTGLGAQGGFGFDLTA